MSISQQTGRCTSMGVAYERFLKWEGSVPAAAGVGMAGDFGMAGGFGTGTQVLWATVFF